MSKVRVELDSGSRRKKWWCKVVTGLDREQEGGYALEGGFVRAGLREFDSGAVLVEYYDGDARVRLVSADVEDRLHESTGWIRWPSRALEVLDVVEAILADPEAALKACAEEHAAANERMRVAEEAEEAAGNGDVGQVVLARVKLSSGRLYYDKTVGKKIRISLCLKSEDRKGAVKAVLREGVTVLQGKIVEDGTYVTLDTMVGVPVGLNVALANGWDHESLDGPQQRLEEARAEVRRLEAGLEKARKTLVEAERATGAQS